MVKALLTCAKCGKMSVPVPCEHCGSTEFVKTQTRRPIKPQPDESILKDGYTLLAKPYMLRDDKDNIRCDWGLFASKNGVFSKGIPAFGYKSRHKVGEIRWVRERARLIDFVLTGLDMQNRSQFRYEADGEDSEWTCFPSRIKPIKLGKCVPNGCFRELARIFIKVTGVGFEQIQDITVADCLREGVHRESDDSGAMWYGETKDSKFLSKDPFVPFVSLWESCYPGSWDRNDWVEKVTFERCGREQ